MTRLCDAREKNNRGISMVIRVGGFAFLRAVLDSVRRAGWWWGEEVPASGGWFRSNGCGGWKSNEGN